MCNFAAENVETMQTIDALTIDLREGNNVAPHREITLSDDFFAQTEGQISGGSVDVDMTIDITASTFKVSLHCQGEVTVDCDRCLEPMSQPIDTDTTLLLRLGTLPDDADPKATQYSADGEQITVSANYGIADLAWPIYETIALNVPLKHVHAPGKCNAAMTEALGLFGKHEISTARSSEDDKQTIDPRWEALKKLKN